MTNENTIVWLLAGLIGVIVVCSLLYVVYVRRLKSSNCSTMTAVYGTLNGKLRSIDNSEPFRYTFKDYYIKTAYNCCSGGQYKNDYVDICALKNVLKQGVRGLDMEVYSIDDQPVVATSTSDNYHVKETFNSVSMADVLSTIRDYAFATSTAPNAQDPVVLHLRIKSNNQEMYRQFALLLETFDNWLLGKEYDSEYYGKNFGDVPLQALKGKMVVIVDRSNPAFLECPEFYKFVNMTSHSVFMRCLTYYDIKFTPDMNELIEYNKQNMTIGLPDRGANPENPSSLVMRETGVQMLGMRYQQVDVNVEDNDVFFDEQGFAFVLKPEALRYKPVTIEAPAAQDPSLSYATRQVKSDFYQFDI